MLIYSNILAEDTRSVADLGVVPGLSVLGIIVITGATVIVITILCLIKKGISMHKHYAIEYHAIFEFL